MATNVQPDVGDVEVGDLMIPAKTPGRCHHRHVNARLLQFFDLLDGQETDITAVGAGVRGETAQVHAGGFFAQVVQGVRRDRTFEFALGVDPTAFAFFAVVVCLTSFGVAVGTTTDLL